MNKNINNHIKKKKKYNRISKPSSLGLYSVDVYGMKSSSLESAQKKNTTYKQKKKYSIQYTISAETIPSKPIGETATTSTTKYINIEQRADDSFALDRLMYIQRAVALPMYHSFAKVIPITLIYIII